MGFAKTAILAINTVTALLGAAMMGIGCYAYLSDRVPIATPEYSPSSSIVCAARRHAAPPRKIY